MLTAIDLFAGAGGATAGLLLGGCDVRLAVECNRDASSSYAANFPAVKLLPNLIEAYTPSVIRNEAALGTDHPGIISACPPCQGFSTLGKCDASDQRNDYVSMVGALVEALSPGALIMENVPGLRDDSRCAELQNQLRDIGYGVNSWVLDATKFCVPQSRRRFILIAVAGLSDAEVTVPLAAYRCSDHPPHPQTVREMLERLEPPNASDPLHFVRRLPNEVLERVMAIPINGGSRDSLPERLQLPCHRRLGRKGARSVYGRMAWDQPAPTITTRCDTPACGRFLHPEEHRCITLREAAAFQGFWPSFRWSGGVLSIAKQIGNAVPVRLAWLLTRHVVELVRTAEGRP
jgi:DNA (cytosine-5)-methyltransferase 1